MRHGSHSPAASMTEKRMRLLNEGAVAGSVCVVMTDVECSDIRAVRFSRPQLGIFVASDSSRTAMKPKIYRAAFAALFALVLSYGGPKPCLGGLAGCRIDGGAGRHGCCPEDPTPRGRGCCSKARPFLAGLHDRGAVRTRVLAAPDFAAPSPATGPRVLRRRVADRGLPDVLNASHSPPDRLSGRSPPLPPSRGAARRA